MPDGRRKNLHVLRGTCFSVRSVLHASIDSTTVSLDLEPRRSTVKRSLGSSSRSQRGLIALLAQFRHALTGLIDTAFHVSSHYKYI